jgi:hypothetical protein
MLSTVLGGRDYCCVGPKRTEKERVKKKNVAAPHNMCQAKKKTGYFGLFLKI